MLQCKTRTFVCGVLALVGAHTSTSVSAQVAPVAAANPVAVAPSSPASASVSSPVAPSVSPLEGMTPPSLSSIRPAPEKNVTLSDYIAVQRAAINMEVSKLNTIANPTPVPAPVVVAVVKASPKASEIEPPMPEPVVLGVMSRSDSPKGKIGIAEVRYLDRVYLLQTNEYVSNSGWIVADVTPSTATLTKRIPGTVSTARASHPTRNARTNTKAAQPVAPGTPSGQTLSRTFKFPEVLTRS